MTDEAEARTYEEARDELLAVVGKLESGGTTLQESIELWERGEALAKRCQELLDGARKRLDDAVANRNTADISIATPE
jgi:exodeoxyribonuclease VII small subunit